MRGGTIPVPRTRDPDSTRAALGQWFRRARPAARRPEVTLLPSPRTGYSSETILFEVEWWEEGEAVRESFAARVRPAGYSLYQEHDLDTQWRVIDALGRSTDVPVPEVVGHAVEEDSPLGQPFFVMRRVEGLVPGDSPPYTVRGWLLDAGPEAQRQVYESGLEALALVGTADWEALGLGFLAASRLHPPGLAAQTRADEAFRDWVASGRPLPGFDDALAWLTTHLPDDRRLALNWGDARLGNIIFRDFRAVALLDWEMTALGPPEADLAWWLTFHRLHSEGRDVAGPPGFPAEDRAVALYERWAGPVQTDLRWLMVRAALRAGLLLYRFNDMLVAGGKIEPDSPHAAHLPARRVLDSLLAGA